MNIRITNAFTGIAAPHIVPTMYASEDIARH